jgi:very-short-patch-repair endonuclease
MTKVEKALRDRFNMSLEDVIQKMHWERKISINEISKRAGVIRQSLMHTCKVKGIKLRDVSEATKLTKNKGANHWAYGLRKENDPRIKSHSVRMKRRNPVLNPTTREKMSESISETFRNNPWPQEVAFAKFLEMTGIRFLDQYVIGPYIIDFFIPSLNLCIEVDTRRHWGHHKRFRSKEKDEYLTANGFTVLRVTKDWALEFSRIGEILLADKFVGKK